jgi:hypothetical protein
MEGELYEKYLYYISTRKMTKGAEFLFKISQPAFEDFVIEYEKNPRFTKKIDKNFISIYRDKKIKAIIGETD